MRKRNVIVLIVCKWSTSTDMYRFRIVQGRWQISLAQVGLYICIFWATSALTVEQMIVVLLCGRELRA